MATYLGKSPARLAIVTDDTITSAKILDNTVTSADILNATITGADLASDISITTTGALVSNGLTVDTNTLYVNSTSNRVGIGTTSPSQTLGIVGSISAGNSAGNHEISLSRTISSPSLIKLQAHSNEPKIMFGTNGVGTYGLRFADDSDNVLMKLTTSGKLAIGTSAPERELHVAGGANMGIALTSSGQTNNIAMADALGSARILQNNGALHFKTGGSANSTG